MTSVTKTEAPLLVAARGGTPHRLPVWFMRQAGRSLPEYRALRADTGMLAACLTPDLACEITLQPVRRHGVDAAILFSDIVVPLHAAGIEVDIVPGTGPVVAAPVRTAGDVERLPGLHVDQVAPVAEAVGLLVCELGSTPLIGFAGAPFTLASYLVEGGPSRNHERTKALMHAAPEIWHALMGRLADMREAGGDVVGADWRIPLDEAWTRIGPDRAIQGNLDPTLLLGPLPRMFRHVDEIIERAGGRPGHIFNLGHGLLPSTPVEHVQMLAQYVHTAARSATRA